MLHNTQLYNLPEAAMCTAIYLRLFEQIIICLFFKEYNFINNYIIFYLDRTERNDEPPKTSSDKFLEHDRQRVTSL